MNEITLNFKKATKISNMKPFSWLFPIIFKYEKWRLNVLNINWNFRYTWMASMEKCYVKIITKSKWIKHKKKTVPSIRYNKRPFL